MRAAVLAASIVAASSAYADVNDPTFLQTSYAQIPDAQATSMAWAPDGSGRLFVTGKNGQIWIIKDGVVQAEPAYTFVPRTQSASGELVTNAECGLDGIAFDPAFADNHYIYVIAVLYVPSTSDAIEQQIIRFTMQGDVATERTTLIAGLPSAGAIHNGGGLAFGPDGLLYWAIGNNGTGLGQDEDLASAGSKIGRASTVVGAPPPPGPFNDGNGPKYDFTYARGVRNPFTMTFHPITGALWVNIVGDGWEQVFAVEEGAHLGYGQENVDPGTGLATLAPVVAYRTPVANGLVVPQGSAVRANDVVTMTTVGAHHLRKGGTIAISDIDDASFDGTFVVTSTPTPTTFTYAQVGPNATSGNGVALPDDYGNVVLGGAFYDATLFPAQYRRNFFFGDFGSGQFVRVETASDNSVSRVSQFGTAMGRHIDTSTGPDGALYTLDHDGHVRRIGYNVTAQGIVVSPQNLRLSETSRGFVGVRLAMAPASNVTVTLSRATGSSVVSVVNGSLTFTPVNWEQVQYVEVASATDADTTEDIATIDATATGIGTETITVRVTDTREPDPSVIDMATPDGTGSSAGGCCGVGGSDSSAFVLSIVVASALRRRRRR